MRIIPENSYSYYRNVNDLQQFLKKEARILFFSLNSSTLPSKNIFAHNDQNSSGFFNLFTAKILQNEYPYEPFQVGQNIH